MAIAPKVYDFPLAKVEDQLVSFLKHKNGESTVADMIAGTGLPKYQVEQAAKAALDEYAGRLKVTESGELLYYFPERDAQHAARRRSIAEEVLEGLPAHRCPGPDVPVQDLDRRHARGVLRRLPGHRGAGDLRLGCRERGGTGRRAGRRPGPGGGGLGGMYIILQLFDLILRMWFWSSILKDPRRKPKKEGRAFYKSVFGFAFGEGDPNQGWDEAERKYIISYIRAHKGVITLEELMALTGREMDAANALLNRLLLEYEGEPGVTDDGTVVYSFPELMRTTEAARQDTGPVPVLNPSTKRVIPFSANKPRTNGWIIFFNAFNLAFGSYFLVISLVQGTAALAKTGPFLYSFAGNFLLRAGISPVPLLEVVLGIIPVAFSVVFFLVPLVRKIRLAQRNDDLRQETLRRRMMAHVLSSPSHVDPRDVRPTGTNLDPRDLPGTARRDPGSDRRCLEGRPHPSGERRDVRLSVQRAGAGTRRPGSLPERHRSEALRGGENGIRLGEVAPGVRRAVATQPIPGRSVRPRRRLPRRASPLHSPAPDGGPIPFSPG